ncbi:squalene/phytoene synthase family protein [Microbacterium betulae]|uniref:Squalene/phytoene synthase family protein n=1 Tax=Microbacterium betulae TaxID=2981139 RepID=A0AA97I6I8_9MICO|nr:squalene/phytoene synthase family protein [Microbacterium sp. AB]WOF22667.1 squalene/phytoene synthase family protein [Microbacterium sp. AB]
MTSGLDLYTRTARLASARVIRAYSTSFGLASRLLPRRVRGHIADVYALVRVADEIVDGPAAEAGVAGAERRSLLDALEAETLAAMARGFSANLVVHAFAATSRQTGIAADLLRPFFSSMRMDADGFVALDEAAYRAYVHGSAEVVGSMCLRAFAQEGRGMAIDDGLEEGARRLGAAFQKVNFLRDLADDHRRLGRSYFPGIDPLAFSEDDKLGIVAEVDDDLAVARSALTRLPPASRRATAAAAGLFGRLNEELRVTPAAELTRRRVSVPRAVKLRVLAAAVAGRPAAGRA